VDAAADGVRLAAVGIVAELNQALSDLGRWLNRRHHHRIAVWRDVAHRRGGTFHERVPAFFNPRPARVDVPVGDALVHLDTYTVQANNSSQTYTRWRATYLLPVGPSFRIHYDRSGFISDIATAFGYEDVLLGGHDGFDAHYVVRTSDDAATRAAVSAAAKERMLAFFPRSRLHADGRTVKLVATGSVDDASRIEAGIDLVAEVASYGARWLDGLRSLSGARWVTPTGPWDARSKPSVQLDLAGVRVWVFPVVDGEPAVLTFCAAAEPQRALPTFALTISDVGTAQPTPPDGTLPSEAKRGLTALGPGKLSFDGKVLRAVLSGSLDQSRLTAAARVVAAVCAGETSLGAFR
jgi:hypothetical protein